MTGAEIATEEVTEEAMAPQQALPEDPGALRSFWASLLAVITKESRWRMRGRRAFVIVTIYLTLLGLLVFVVYQSIYNSAILMSTFNSGSGPTSFVPGSVSASIGQGVFMTILILQTLLAVMLAPGLTSGAIASEREKQTLELLITTPVSTLGMIIGKLVSQLAYVLILTAASVPLLSVVFAFGGIAPDDVVRAYVLLVVLAFGLGSIGLFMSALIKRTQIATALAYVLVFMLTFGSFVLHSWMYATSQSRFGDFEDRHAPQFLLWLNPLVADADLMCTAIPDQYGATCNYSAMVLGTEFNPANPPRDALWPRIAVAYLVLGVVLTLATTQLIAPSRRARLRGPRAAPAQAPGGP